MKLVELEVTSCFLFLRLVPFRDKWRIIIDTNLMKINSFPHFFHGDYCATQVCGLRDYTFKN